MPQNPSSFGCSSHPGLAVFITLRASHNQGQLPSRKQWNIRGPHVLCRGLDEMILRGSIVKPTFLQVRIEIYM